MMRNEKFHKSLHNDFIPTIEEQLLNEGKLVFEQGKYKIPEEKPDSNFETLIFYLI